MSDSPNFTAWAREIERLHRAVVGLVPAAEFVGVDPPAGQEWFELLTRKLLPQAAGEPTLVAAVVGGTNTGKSALFNHLAGEVASRVVATAAGTKHPVCLVPPALADETLLERLFEGFDITPWQSAEDALADLEEDRLYWREGPNLPPKLLLLDTPDIDSDVRVNWRRADHIRQAADVLIAVLTLQKYNDAAVKQFFRAAAAADKPLVVIFNQCDLEADRDYWPLWLATFSGETGAQPTLVYVVPHDRAAAGVLALQFFSIGADGRAPPTPAAPREDLAQLRFDEIKLRTLGGAAASVLDGGRGLPAWLERIRRQSAEYAAAATALSPVGNKSVDWPTLPPRVLMEEFRDWWDDSRVPWSRKIHGVYRSLGQAVMKPVHWVTSSWSEGPTDVLETFRQQERKAILRGVQALLDQLDRLALVGGPILRTRLQHLLGGPARQTLLTRVEASHAELPSVSDDYRRFLRRELEQLRAANPRATRLLSWLDQGLAVMRPVITLGLFSSGFFAVGHVAAPMMANFAVDAAMGVTTTAAGEALVGGAAEGLKHSAAQLLDRLQLEYAAKRKAWLDECLKRELLGGLLADLRRGAETPQSPEFRAVEASLRNLRAAQP